MTARCILVNKPFLRKVCKADGFSLAETLVALLILTMVSIIVATGVPSAIGAYRNVVASSNAQVALSTVASALRDELGTARSASPASGQIEAEFTVDTYVCGEGYKAKIQPRGTDDHGPVKATNDDLVDSKTWTLVPNAQIVATQNDLYVDYSKITFDPDNQVFKVYGLKVVQNGSSTPLAEIKASATEGSEGYLAIRAPYCVAKAPTG